MNRYRFAALLAALVFSGAPVATSQEVTKPETSPSTTVAQAPATGAARPKREPTPAMRAARERQKVCAKNWRTDKAAGKTTGQKWPQYWSACNKKLKATAGA